MKAGSRLRGAVILKFSPGSSHFWFSMYIHTREDWLYLAVVLDLFSRRIVGWSMGEAITAELACRALDIAWHSRLPARGLVFHIDRGSHYASRCYTDLLAGHGIKASMSRTGNCCDNACSEPCSAR
jgi:putative transposase